MPRTFPTMATTEPTERTRKVPDGVKPAAPLEARGRPNGSRRLLVLGLAVAAPLAAFLPLAYGAWKNDVFAWDEAISKAIHAQENRETVWNRHVDVFDVVLDPFVELLGLLFVGAVLLLFLAHRRYRGALFIALGVGGTAVLAILLKEFFARPPVDPGGGGFTFPSGHAMMSMAAATVMAVVAWPTRLRWPTVGVGGIMVVLIGVAVVYHEWHWASDVVAGWLVSVAWIGCVWVALSGARGERGLASGSGDSERERATRRAPARRPS